MSGANGTKAGGATALTGGAGESGGAAADSSGTDANASKGGEGGSASKTPEQLAADKATAEKAAADKAAADKAAAEKAAADKAAAEKGKSGDLELKLPDGFQADEKVLGGFKAKAKELGLDGAKASDLLGFYAQVQKDAAAQQEQHVEQTRKAWKDAQAADKEFGGAELQKNIAAAHKVMTKYGTAELKSFLDDTGLGDHPELLRFFVRIAKADAEDTIADDETANTTGNAAAADHQAQLKALYPTMFKQKQS